RTGRAAQGGVAWTPDLRPASDGADARDARPDRAARGPELERVDAAQLRAERASQRAAVVPRDRGRLHPPGVCAAAALRGSACRSRPGLAGRFLLPVPWVAFRPRRARVRGRPGPDEPAGAAVSVRHRQHDHDRVRHRERMMASTEADVFDRLGRRLRALNAWIDDRIPLTATIKYHATEYYAAKNFN